MSRLGSMVYHNFFMDEICSYLSQCDTNTFVYSIKIAVLLHQYYMYTFTYKRSLEYFTFFDQPSVVIKNAQEIFYATIHRTRLQFFNVKKNMDAGFAKIRTIQSIELNECNITSQGIYYLQNVKNLYLENITTMDDESYKHLWNMPRLELRNMEITSKGFRYLKHLQYLSLDSCSSITDKDLSYLVDIPSLKFIRMHISVGLCYLNKVKKMRLYDCPFILGVHFKNLRNIERIEVDMCESFHSDDGLYFLRNVKEIYLSSMNITDQGIFYLRNVPTVFIDRLDALNVLSYDGVENLKGENVCIKGSYSRGKFIDIGSMFRDEHVDVYQDSINTVTFRRTTDDYDGKFEKG